MDKEKTRSPGSPNMTFVSNVIYDLKKSLRAEPHTLEEIRRYLAEAKTEDVELFDLLKDHHNYLKESIVFLIDKEASPSEKQFHLSRFIHLLEMHGKAEQETLYKSLMANDDQTARIEGLAGQTEHDVAFEAVDELRALDFENEWTEKADATAKVLASAVANHIKEEESEMFPTAKRDLSSEELKTLTANYIDSCAIHLDLETKNLGPKFTN